MYIHICVCVCLDSEVRDWEEEQGFRRVKKGKWLEMLKENMLVFKNNLNINVKLCINSSLGFGATF